MRWQGSNSMPDVKNKLHKCPRRTIVARRSSRASNFYSHTTMEGWVAVSSASFSLSTPSRPQVAHQILRRQGQALLHRQCRHKGAHAIYFTPPCVHSLSSSSRQSQWDKRWFVLRGGSTMLEYYKAERDADRGLPPAGRRLQRKKRALSQRRRSATRCRED